MMCNNELLLSIYKMKDRQACLVFKNTGKPCKLFNLIEVLHFAGEMKLLSVAIDTGAAQNYPYCLRCADGLEHSLKCRFVQEVVALELWFKEQLRFSWQGTAKEFRVAVDRMLTKLPRFF
ncbi:hypothetical protein HDC92_003806 [Pedobacter sp. AK017]|uniref:hypothetical protein n=1 Tax=Pedobacter sp. AK017 TaxID=2723073 RepID=UPI0017C5E6C0|nr:hypothetical protein [Pedobacter sp. AK017]MBB5440108.1 hypothetical protein [Pedobacter sp. AK017]